MRERRELLLFVVTAAVLGILAWFKIDDAYRPVRTPPAKLVASDRVVVNDCESLLSLLLLLDVPSPI